MPGPIDEFTLLCERCGYMLEGLVPDGPCPECGTPIVDSLPARRPGTPWQQKRSLKSYVVTSWLTVRHPKRTLRETKAEPVYDRNLAVTHCWLGLTLLLAGFIIDQGPESDIDGLIGRLIFVPIVGCLLSAIPALLLVPVFYVLIMIERIGLSLFSRKHGTRLSPAYAGAITAHGAVGWVIVGLGVMTSSWLFAAYHDITGRWPPSLVRVPGFGVWFDVTDLLGIFGVLAGFMFFECFAYLGAMRLKYANRDRPAEQE